MKAAAVPLALICVLSGCCLPSAHMPLPPPQGTAFQSVYRIGIACEGSEQSGTAFAIGPTTIVTARHVVRCPVGVPIAAVIRRGNDTGSDIETISMRIHNGADVAVLTLRAPVMSWLAVAPNAPEPGDEVCIVTGWLVPKCGRVFPYGPAVAAAIRGIPGNSGSPLLDTHGRVVGVLSMATIQGSGVEDLIIAAPSTAVLELLQRVD